MSDRTKGLLNISANFEPQTAEPFDARMRVTTKASLLLEATWASSDSNVYTYVGMIVSVYDDTLQDNGVYRLIAEDYTVQSNWVKVNSISLIEDTTYYVDGDNGDDSDDGLTWGTAKKTMAFLYSGDADAIPREINANVVVNSRGNVYSKTADRHTEIDKFYGSGTLKIAGTFSDVVVGQSVTGYDNTVTNVTYHSYIDSGAASWGIDDYKGMFVQFTTPASDILYPILSNTATRIETISLPALAGTEVFKVVRPATELISATYSSPGTIIHHYPEYFIVRVHQCFIPIEISGVKYLTSSESANYFSIGSDSKNDQENSVSEFKTGIKYSVTSTFLLECFNVDILSCFIGYNPGGYSGISNSILTKQLYVKNCVLDGVKTTSQTAIFAWHPTTLSVEGNRFFNYDVAIGTESFCYITLGNNLIESCNVGVQLNRSTWDCFDINRYNRNDICINLTGTQMKVYGVLTNYGNLNRKDIIVANTPTEVSFTFAQLAAKEEIYNTKNNALVQYYKSGDSISVTSYHEYSRTNSGLDAYNYQEAIDILAARSIEQDITYYVDGDIGSDSNNGLSWGTAKKTFSFLYSGDGYAIPREINANVVVNSRGNVYSKTADRHTEIDKFYGSGTLKIAGTFSDVVVGQSVTGYDNTVTNVTYHSYIDSGAASWGIDDYKGMFVQFTTPASDILYPILSNTATRIETISLPALAGTEVFKVVRPATELISATYSSPGTIIFNYPHWLILRVHQCFIQIEISGIKYLTSNENINFIEVGSNSRNDTDNSVSEFKVGIKYSTVSVINPNGNVDVLSCFVGSNGANLYSGISNNASMRVLSIKNCIFYGSKATSQAAILAWHPTTVEVTGNRFFNCDLAIASESFCYVIIGENLIEACDVGIQLNRSTWDSFQPNRFKGNDVCINLTGTQMKIMEVPVNYGESNRKDIIVADSPTEVGFTFAQLAAKEEIYNTKNGALVQYYKPGDNTSVTSYHEYSRTNSGLDAYNYQEAIDLLATFATRKASASQDGYLGKDDFVTFSNGGAAYKIYEGNTKAEVHDTGSDGYFWVATEGVEKFRVSPDGKVGIGQNSPTAMLHLPAGTVVANTAPLKFVTGNALSNPEDGVVEYHSSHLYFTIGSTRYQLDQQGGGGSLQVSYGLGNEISLTSGVPVKITNNYAASAAIEISGTGRREIHSTDDIVLASDGETYFVDGGYTGTQGPDGYIPLTDSGARDFTFPCSSLVDAINKAYVGSGGNFNWSGTTTNDTPTEIFVGGIASARYTLTAISTTYLSLSVIARDNTNNRSKIWEVKAAAQNPSIGTADWISLTPTYTVIDQTDPSGGTNDWDIVLSINDPDKTVRVTVTGQTGCTIQWAVLN